jgi:hypothetical protein
MTHLGTLISALADGQMAPAPTERALAHVASCDVCAADLAAQRAARAALAAASQVPVAEDFASRLLALPATRGLLGCASTTGHEGGERGVQRVLGSLCVLRRRVSGRAARPVPMPPTRSERMAIAGRLPAAAGRGELPVRSVVAVVVAVAGVWLFAAGEEESIIPLRHPAQVLSLLASAGATPGSGASDAQSEPVPEGYQVVSVREDGGGVEVDLDGPYGMVVVTRQTGRLDLDAVAYAPVVQVGGNDVRVLSTEPWHVVWQSGDTVVSVVSDHPSPASEAVATAYPEEPFDDGLPAQISRGWQVAAGAWRP